MELAAILSSFYAEVRDQEGGRYSQSTMRGIRAGINRHLKMPPHNKNIDITKDREFCEANHIFEGYIKANIVEGNAKVKHKPSMTDRDWEILLNSKELDPRTPKGLQNKVFVNIMTHFSIRGREGLRELRKESFVVRGGDTGLEYVEVNKNFQNFQGAFIEDKVGSERMEQQPNDPKCPVSSFKLYVSKLNREIPTFFCYPVENPAWTYHGKTWYTKKQLGVNTVGNWMTKLSKEVGLTKPYTNHCLRATAATRLVKARINDTQAMSVRSHNHESLLSHITESNASEMRHLSTLLHIVEPLFRAQTAATPSSPASALRKAPIEQVDKQPDTQQPELQPDTQ